MRGRCGLLLDCDNAACNLEISSLTGSQDFTVIAIANDIGKLPKLDGTPFGELVPIYQNASDFRMVARVAVAIERGEISDVVLVTRDRALARAIQEYSNGQHVACYRYSYIEDAMAHGNK